MEVVMQRQLLLNFLPFLDQCPHRRQRSHSRRRYCLDILSWKCCLYCFSVVGCSSYFLLELKQHLLRFPWLLLRHRHHCWLHHWNLPLPCSLFLEEEDECCCCYCFLSS